MAIKPTYLLFLPSFCSLSSPNSNHKDINYTLLSTCIYLFSGGVGCVGDDCRCNTASPGEASSDGGWLYDKEHLPVGHVLLAAITQKNATRCLYIQPLRCYSKCKCTC